MSDEAYYWQIAIVGLYAVWFFICLFAIALFGVLTATAMAIGGAVLALLALGLVGD